MTGGGGGGVGDVLNVVRVVRVDVPSVVRAHDAKSDSSAAAAGAGAGGRAPPPLLLGCAYALEGGENDDENGEVSTARPTNATGKRLPEVAMDAAMEELQRQRGLVVKWYFRRNPVPVAPNDAMAIINDNEQVYQWIAGGGPEAGGGLGPLSGRTVDVTAETPRVDKSALHRIIRVERPTAELTGEYRCQVEDWNAERRSVWHPMVVYSEYRKKKKKKMKPFVFILFRVNLSSTEYRRPSLSTRTPSPPPKKKIISFYSFKFDGRVAAREHIFYLRRAFSLRNERYYS